MELREYLFRNRIKVGNFADSLEYCRQHIGGIANGTSYPSLRVAKMISEFTGGQVSVEELINPKKRKANAKPQSRDEAPKSDNRPTA